MEEGLDVYKRQDVNRTKFLEREPSHKECLDNMVRPVSYTHLYLR